MAKRSTSSRSPQPGWAIYLRTSDKETQNPANSQNRQRLAIHRALLDHSELPVIGEYIDNQTGRASARRIDYQRLLLDARAGKFSHVAAENAERFGRNDAEALSAIDELHAFGVAVRVADYPDLDPIDPDDRILVSLSFTLARRESMKTGERVRGGMFSKLDRGGHIGRAPDGYINRERRTDSSEKLEHGRYERWIEPDPERWEIWRLAWDLLLTNRHTLESICEELHARGYRLRSGRPFVTIDAKGNRKYASNTLSKTCHNWTYAGWVTSEKAEIPPKTVRGDGEPLVTTEEFEQDLVILKKHAVLSRRSRSTDEAHTSLASSGVGSRPQSHRRGRSPHTPVVCSRQDHRKNVGWLVARMAGPAAHLAGKSRRRRTQQRLSPG